MAELADIQAQENQQVINDTPAEKSPVIGQKLSLREELKKNFSEAAKPDALKPKIEKPDDKPRDETGKFVKTEAVEQAPPVETPEAKPKDTKLQGPPPGWSAESKAFFDTLPPDHPLRKDIAKREEEVSTGFKQKSEELKRYQEVEQVLNSARPTYQRMGISDGEAIKRLFAWEGYIRSNPQQAIQEIARQYGVNLAQPSPPQEEVPAQLRPYIDQFGQVRQELNSIRSETQRMQEESISNQLKAFAKDKPHFERVRVTMGQLMNAGLAPDLDSAYQQAIALNPEIQSEIKAKEEADRQTEQRAKLAQAAKAAVSPTTRAPAAPIKVETKQPGVRGSILASIEQLRGNGRA